MKLIKFNKLSLIVFFITFFSVFFFLICPGAADITPGQEHYYALYWDNNLFGYSHYFVTTRLSLGGESFYKINSDSRIKIGEGKINDVKFVSELIIDSKDYTPASFNILQEFEKQRSQIQIIFSKGLAAQNNVAGKAVEQYFEDIPPGTYLLINNLWGKFDNLIDNYLILASLAKKEKSDKEFFVYDPIVRTSIKLTLKYIQDEKIEIKNKKYSCELFNIIDPAGEILFNLWIDKGKSVLVKISEASGFLQVVVSDESITKQLDKIKGLDLWDQRVAVSNFILPKTDKINYFKVNLNSKLKGNLMLNHKVNGFSQDFEAQKPEEQKEEIKIKEKPEADKANTDTKETQTKEKESQIKDLELIQGDFQIKTSNFETKESFRLPSAGELDPSISKFLKPQLLIESEEKIITDLVSTITWNNLNFSQAAEEIIDWVKRNIKLEAGGIPSAKMTLENKFGNVQGISNLTAALCRARGIPARVVGGLIYSAGNFVPHYWVEVYLAKDNWVMTDPALGETDKLSAVHIALYSPGDISRPQIKVLDFLPRPDARVAFFRKELVWPIKEKRVYLVKQNDKIAAEEIVQLTELNIFEDEESYCFESQLSFTDSENKILSDWKVTPFGLPLYFKIVLKQNKKEDYSEYTFSQDTVNQIISKDNKKKELSLPVSKGVYLADNRVLSQLAMALGQIPDPQIGHKYTLYVFSPQNLTAEPIEVEIKQSEQIQIKDKTYQTLRGESPDNLVFWLDKSGRVIKINFPSQNLEYILDSFEAGI